MPKKNVGSILKEESNNYTDDYSVTADDAEKGEDDYEEDFDQASQEKVTKKIVKAIESKKASGRISIKGDSFGKNLLPMSNSVEASYSEIDEESPKHGP